MTTLLQVKGERKLYELIEMKMSMDGNNSMQLVIFIGMDGWHSQNSATPLHPCDIHRHELMQFNILGV